MKIFIKPKFRQKTNKSSIITSSISEIDKFDFQHAHDHPQQTFIIRQTMFLLLLIRLITKIEICPTQSISKA